MADQVKEIKDRVNIVDIIGETMTLKKAGRNYKGLCPFHSEKTPSFMVNPELGIYKCFGCGEGGDVIEFLQKTEGYEFYDALKLLADRVGVKLEPISYKKGSDSVYYEINSQAANFYHYILTEHKLGAKAKVYLKEKRGLDNNIIVQFKIGFAPNTQSALFNYLSKKKGYEPKTIEDAGLVYNRSGRHIDRFRGRIIFPINNHRGDTIALGGRILPDYETSKTPKYINSPQTVIYNKSNSLYAIDLAKNAIRKKDFVIVTEGELDAISSHKIGLENTIAAKGTALTEGQLNLISRYTKEIVFAMDSDFAGAASSERAIKLAQSQGFSLKVANMLPYKDPDEYVQADPDGYLKAIEKASDIWQFLIDNTLNKFDIENASQKAKASKQLTLLLSQITDSIMQSHYIQYVSHQLAVPTESVESEIKKNLKASHTYTYKKNEPSGEANIKKEIKTRRELLEEEIIQMAFSISPNILAREEVIDLFSSNLYRKIALSTQSYFAQEGDFDPKLFLEYLTPELVEGFSSIYINSVENINERDLKKAVHSLSIIDKRAKLIKLSNDIKQLENSNDEKGIEILQKEFVELSHELNRLEESLELD